MFRFTIRELVLLTLVVALAVGWWIDHQQFSPEDRAVLRAIKQERKTATPWQSYPPTRP